MRFLGRSLVGLLLICATLGLLALAGGTVMRALAERQAETRPERPAREQVFAAQLVRAEPERIVPRITTFGEVRSRRRLELRAAASGAVSEIGPGVEEGGAVRQGDLLFRIDPATAQTALDLARADLTDAQAELREARRGADLARSELSSAQAQETLRSRALTRQEDLRGRGVGTEAAVEAADLAAAAAAQAVLARQQALSGAEARIDQATSLVARRTIALREAERSLGDTEIRAAFDGVLSGVDPVVGRLVGNNERLAELIDPDALEIAFTVSTLQYTRLLDAAGALIPAPVHAAIDLGSAELTATGRIDRESAAVDSGQTGRQLFARLGRAPGFRPGDFVSVAIEEPAIARAVRLPASALGSDGTVLALGPEDRLESLPVEVLRREGDRVILAADGIAGRELVARRSPMLGAGIAVRPQRLGDAPEEAGNAAASGGAEGGVQAPDPGSARGPTAAAARARNESGAGTEARTRGAAPPGDANLTAAAADAPALPDPPDGTVRLSAERRARLVAFVEASDRMPAAAKARILAELRREAVPAGTVARIEARMGG